MSHNDDMNFIPVKIDEQIEHYLSNPHSASGEQAAQRTVQGLQRTYQVKGTEHTPSLERVWQRVQNADAWEHALPSASELVHDTAEKQEAMPQGLATLLAGPGAFPGQRTRTRRTRMLFVQVAAVLCIALIVGSFALASNLSQHEQLSPLQKPLGGGLYGYLYQAIYRLDSSTHHILWKHAFASNEFVQGGGGSPFADTTSPTVVGGILYVEVRENSASGRLYLYALSTASGAVLWRQPSVWAFVNHLAVYTLVESTTSEQSTLTARDPRTGKQLWQRQYPIAGSRDDLGRGTDLTEGFRLITVNDQLLYAVAAYRHNGQNIFARYGLSPKDGSILWQNRDVISDRMPAVVAQMVNGVVYTVEYSLKPVPQHVDSHGMTVTEINQSRAAAYDAATGKRRWQTPEMVGEMPNGAFSLQISGTMLYFQTFAEDWPAGAPQFHSIITLHALSTSNGASRWRYQMPDGGMTGAVLEGASLYFEISQVKTTGGLQDLHLSVVALNAQTGAVRWSTPVKLLDGTEKTPTPAPRGPDPGFSNGYAIDMAPVASEDTVYYSTPGNRVYALRASDGKILTQFGVDKTDQTTVLDRVVLLVAP